MYKEKRGGMFFLSTLDIEKDLFMLVKPTIVWYKSRFCDKLQDEEI
jgi:hypothetical protein